MITCRGLAYRYKAGPLIAFADMTLPQGGVLMVSGPSGCGKSTWLALVAALMRPAAGQIEVAGQALAGLSAAAADAWRARNIGFLPQRLHLSAALSVQRNLALAQWAASQPEDLAAISRALESLGVADLAQRKPAQLSGGQAQRVALARAVLMQPKLILADEPTASLDDEAAAAAVALMHQTALAQGATLVIASHDVRVAALLMPRLASPAGLQTMQLPRLAAMSKAA
jgi:putative ABC transport system ATP-binding protein